MLKGQILNIALWSFKNNDIMLIFLKYQMIDQQLEPIEQIPEPIYYINYDSEDDYKQPWWENMDCYFVSIIGIIIGIFIAGVLLLPVIMWIVALIMYYIMGSEDQLWSQILFVTSIITLGYFLICLCCASAYSKRR